MNTADPGTDGKSWNTYWQGTSDTGAFSDGGVNHPAVAAFWSDFLSASRNRYDRSCLLDIATGNGVVVEMSLDVLGMNESAVTYVDISAAAIDNVKRRYPAARGIVADARSIPLDDAGFNLVVSQFGVEYAGVDAVFEAARMVAPGGQLVLVMHIENGSIQQECAASLAAIEKIQACQFVPLAHGMFTAGFAAVRGADRTAYEEAGKSFAPSIRAVEKILTEYGEHVAGDTIARLYSDVGDIHSRMQKYEPDDVLGWLDTMETELVAYADRMSSMLAAALSTSTFDTLCGGLRARGLTLDRAEPLRLNEREPALAWVLVASRGNNDG